MSCNSQSLNAELNLAAVSVVEGNIDCPIHAKALHAGWLSEEEFDALIDPSSPDYIEDFEEFMEFKMTFALFMVLATEGEEL